MNEIYISKENIILLKGICEVLYSNEVDYVIFFRVFRDDKVMVSYKIYWMLFLLDEIFVNNVEIEFRILILI